MKHALRQMSCLLWALTLVVVLAGAVVTKPGRADAAACPATASDAASARTLAKACGGRVEAMSERTGYRQVFANANGSYTSEDSVVPVRVQRADGSWVGTDPSFARTGAGWAPRAVPFDVTVSNGGDGPFATYRTGGQTVTLSWPYGTLPAPVVSGATVRYPSVLPGVDLWVVTSATGFRPVVQLADATAAADPRVRALAYRVGGTVHAVANPDGRVRFADAKNATVAMTDPAVMWDSTPGGAPSTAADPGDAARVGQVAVTSGGADLTVVPDVSLLASATYPVFVDPSISPAQNRFAYADSANANNSTDYARVGKDPTGGTLYRSYFNFPTTSGSLTWKGKKILSAEFDIELYHSYACNDTQDDWTWAYQTANIKASPRMPWSGSGAVGLPGAAGEAARGHANKAGGCGANQPDMLMSFAGSALTTQVQKSADGNWSLYTIGLCACNTSGDYETSTDRWKKFHIDSRAKLVVSFDTVPGTPTTLSTSGAACGSRIGSLTATMSARAVDGDSNDTLQATFHYQQLPSGAVVSVSRTGIPANNTTTAALSLPASADGTTYQWQVQTKDAAGYSSAWTAWCTFTVDIAAPPLPTVAPTGTPAYALCDPAGIGTCVANGGPGVPGTFTFSPNGATNVTSFSYGWTSPPTTKVTVAAGASATVTVTPPEFGLNTLYVASNNGVKFGGTLPYHFLVAAPSAALGYWPLDDINSHGLTDQVSGTPLAAGSGVSWTPDARYLGASAATFSGDPATGAGTATVAALDTSTSFSVGAWVRPAALDGNRTAVGVDDSGTTGGFSLGLRGSHWAFTVPGTASASPTTALTAAATGRWVFLVGVYDAGAATVSLYVNGTLAATVARTSATTRATGPLTVGRGRAAGAPAEAWSGGIGDVRVWNRVVTSDDIWGTDADPDNGVPSVGGLMSPTQVASWGFADTADCGCGGPTLDGSYFGHSLSLDPGWANATPTSAFVLDSHDGDGALRTDGVTGYASTTGPVLRTDQSFTASAWVNLSSLPTGNATAVAQDGTVDSGFLLGYNHTATGAPQWTFMVVGTDTTEPPSAAALSAGAAQGWTHLVGVYDAVAGTVKLYVNGTLATTASGATSFQAGGPLTVGHAKWDGHVSDSWPGQLDEVQLWQGVLSDRQVAGLYQNS